MIVIVMDSGLAKLCSISEHITTVLASIEIPMPKKRPGASTHGKAVDRFFHLVMEVLPWCPIVLSWILRDIVACMVPRVS